MPERGLRSLGFKLFKNLKLKYCSRLVHRNIYDEEECKLSGRDFNNSKAIEISKEKLGLE